jgi:predicted nuclease of predicted toxin-antitoxin system
MKLEVDENLPVEIALSLREAGHDALTVLDQGLGGYADGHVADVCKRERRALVTLDTDFAKRPSVSSRRILGAPGAEIAAAGQAACASRVPTDHALARN